MRDFPTPVVVTSKCLEVAACRYNGARVSAPFVTLLERHVTLRPVCPEEEIGLGTPRDPIRLVQLDGRTHLVQPSTGRDVTRPMEEFAATYLGGVDAADGFILKSRSPSCGIKDAKTFTGDGHPQGKQAGLFARAVLARFPHAAIEDEGRLTNARLRHHFLVKIFALAAFRAVRRRGTMGALVEFHARHKLQLMANNQTALRTAGRIVANPERHAVASVFEQYEEQLARALARPARDRSTINALQHAFGYFSKQLSGSEKRHFLHLLDEYRAGRALLTVPLSLIQSWIARFDEPYLREQTFVQPYPSDLMQLTDSGRA